MTTVARRLFSDHGWYSMSISCINAAIVRYWPSTFRGDRRALVVDYEIERSTDEQTLQGLGAQCATSYCMSSIVGSQVCINVVMAI